MPRDAKVGLALILAFLFLFCTVLVHRLRSVGAKPNDQFQEQEFAQTGATDPPAPQRAAVVVPAQLPDDAASALDEQTFDSGTLTVKPPATDSLSMSPDDPLEETHRRATNQIENTSDPSTGAQILLSGVRLSQGPSAEPTPSNDPPGPAHAETEPVPQATHPSYSGGLMLQIPRGEPAVTDTSQADVPQPSSFRGSASTSVDGTDDGSGAPVTEQLVEGEPTAADPSQYQIEFKQRDLQGEIPPRSSDLVSPAPLSLDDSPRYADPGSEPPTPAVPSGKAEPVVLPPHKSLPARRPPVGFEPDQARNVASSDPWQPLSQATARALGEQTYVVQPGDSFWSISVRFYGSGRYFRKLEQYNVHGSEQLKGQGSWRRTLRPGDVVVLPDPSTLLPPSPASTGSGMRHDYDSSGVYRVKTGDTLSRIARRILGSETRWREIYRLNREKLLDPHQLVPGMELYLPSDRGQEKVPQDPYRRR